MRDTEVEVSTQRVFGTWSVILGAVGVVFAIIAMALAIEGETPVQTYLFLVLGILGVLLTGLVLGVVGQTYRPSSYRGWCTVGAVFNVAVLVVGMLAVVLLSGE